jgi:hypothetical protein
MYNIKFWHYLPRKLECQLNFLPPNLLGCNQVSHVYLCDKTGILKLDQSCLGTLYNQQFGIARVLCPMKIINPEEIIYRLNNNRHLVYTPVKQFPSISRAKVQKNFSRGESPSFISIQDAKPPSNTTTSLPMSQLPWTQASSTSPCHVNPKWGSHILPLSTLNNICKTWKLMDNIDLHHSGSPTAKWRASLYRMQLRNLDFSY